MNEKLTCIIVDDEPPAVRILQKYAAQLPDLECVASATKSLEALQLVEQYRPDILFLDIQMPELTGIQISKLLKNKVKIIFTTAYTQFAVEGYELDIVDYLLKPVSFERFVSAVQKVRKQMKTSEHISHWDDSFFVKTDGKNRFVKVCISDIFYLESIRNYVVLHTGTQQIITYNTLKYYEENLPSDRFVKIHKSFLVALSKIEKTTTGEVWIMGKELPLGDTYKNVFFEAVNRRIL